MSNADTSGLKPLLSIVCPSYNHGGLVASFIESLLVQTDARFEVIIIDDASSDNNLSVIKAHDDPRIRLVARKVNRGFCSSINEGILLSRADYVAILASDDLAHPRYVERVIKAFETSPLAVAVYVELDRMSEDGTTLNNPCRLPVRCSRLEILRRSFLGENQFPCPGMAFRREVAQGLLLPEGTVQYSDWMLQNRILMSGEIVMLEEQLVRYRVSTSSLSARSPASMARDLLETRIMMDDFLKIQDMDFLAQVFPVESKPYAGLPLRHLPYVLGRLALLSDNPEKRSWGYEIIMRHLSEPGVSESLQALAGFTHKDLMALAPTEAAARIEEIRLLRRRTRHLRRWIVALACGLALALWVLCK
jgi:glycosyltransferase involved in cell wall biosynthesis